MNVKRAVPLLVVGAAVVLAVVAWVLVDGRDQSSPDTTEQAAEPTGPTRRDVAAVGRQAGVGNPSRPALPEVENRQQVVAFLDGEGSGLVDVHTVLVALLDRNAPNEADCRAVAAQLDELFVPAELYQQAAAVPDSTTSELFVNLAASTTRFLGVCPEGDEVLRGELAYQWVLIDRRLDDLGVAS